MIPQEASGAVTTSFLLILDTCEHGGSIKSLAARE
jgi:hypothetical protein